MKKTVILSFIFILFYEFFYAERNKVLALPTTGALVLVFWKPCQFSGPIRRELVNE